MRTPSDDRDQDLNPHRDADRLHASSVAASQLRHRGIDVDERESSDDMAAVLSAVERFETAVSVLGGDRMVNSLDTDQHDDESLVLPRRRADESLTAYAVRVTRAAEALGRRSS
ncbi:hypothetical protein J421_4206 [Gemmatirosa kalamazoonensis]|uniref:Uncharacterized protein n=1 Tax=Gemmatirosa kalamazoonensis TaxID=861299 RepID=W0RQE4_9BACT|nr:hypothetical protein [Gemmatirosa kalamazoonensis]AHG91743.1 hypothetical protein J421_4206 [Gemmatirosa kalamazoonensis]